MAILESSRNNIDLAAQLLARGELVIFPTETVYGLGGDATNDHAVAKIYKVKKRPTFNPLIAHFYSVEQLQEYVDLPSTATVLAQEFWPGPLTLVLKRKKNSAISLLASAGLDSIGVRIPNHPVALSLIETFRKPIVAPSANISYGVSPTSAQAAVAALGHQDIFTLDGEKCSVGIESTVIDISGDKATILRSGAITVESLSNFLDINDCKEPAAKSIGQIHDSYNSLIRLNVTKLNRGEVLLAFGDPRKIFANSLKIEKIQNRTCLNLSDSENLLEAAANLFAMLRALDSMNPTAIAVMPIPNVDIGIAINDRLTKLSGR